MWEVIFPNSNHTLNSKLNLHPQNTLQNVLTRTRGIYYFYNFFKYHVYVFIVYLFYKKKFKEHIKHTFYFVCLMQ